MPDHFHLLLTVNSGMTIERAVEFVKGGFAFRADVEWGMQATLWRRGFSETRVLDATAFEAPRNYIHENPVRAHLAPTAREYQYSSAKSSIHLDPPPAQLVHPAPEGARIAVALKSH